MGVESSAGGGRRCIGIVWFGIWGSSVRDARSVSLIQGTITTTGPLSGFPSFDESRLRGLWRTM